MDGRRRCTAVVFALVLACICTSADATAPPECLTRGAGIARWAIPLPGTDWLVYNDAWYFWTMKLDGSDKQKLPVKKPGGEVRFHSVSPDGTSILYSCIDWSIKREGGAPTDILLARLDGSAPARRITPECPPGRQGYWYPAWGPDGKRVLFASDQEHPGKGFDVFAMVLDDPHPPVKLADGIRPSWSPDGTRVAFDGWTARDPSVLFVLELGGKRLPVVRPSAG